MAFSWTRSFRFFFKYPLLVFEQGDFVLGVSRPIGLLCSSPRPLAAAALITYRSIAHDGPTRDKIVLVALAGWRCVAVLLFCLVRPTLVLKAAVPQQNFLGILVDDSRSMMIADRDGQPRSQFVQRELTGPNATLLSGTVEAIRAAVLQVLLVRGPRRVGVGRALRRHVDPARRRARARARRTVGAAACRPRDGHRRRRHVRRRRLDDPLASLKARSIPVFPVGLGQERFTRDIQISRVETPRIVLKGSSLVVDVVVTQTGYSGKSVALNVEDAGRIVTTQQITLPPDGQSLTAKRPVHGQRRRRAIVPLPGGPAGRRRGHAEQRA